MPKSAKTVAKTSSKKAAAKPQKLARPAKTTLKKADQDQPHHGFMWKLLDQKKQRQKQHDQKQSEAHVKMHEQSSQDGLHKQNGFSRFAGPRRKAA